VIRPGCSDTSVVCSLGLRLGGLGFGFGLSFFGSVFGGGVSTTRSVGSVGSAGRMDVVMSDVCSSEKVSRPCWGG